MKLTNVIEGILATVLGTLVLQIMGVIGELVPMEGIRKLVKEEVSIDIEPVTDYLTPKPAETDGLVVAKLEAKQGETSAIICGYAGNNKDELSQRNTVSMQYSTEATPNIYLPHSSFTMPVKKGEFWKVDVCSEKSGSEYNAIIFWVPFGAK